MTNDEARMTNGLVVRRPLRFGTAPQIDNEPPATDQFVIRASSFGFRRSSFGNVHGNRARNRNPGPVQRNRRDGVSVPRELFRLLRDGADRAPAIARRQLPADGGGWPLYGRRQHRV